MPCRCQEPGHRCGVVIKHLSACEPAITKRVQTENFTIEASTFRTQSALMPENDNILVMRSDYMGIHLSFGLRGLQGIPGGIPSVGPRFETAEVSTKGRESGQCISKSG